eukprot:990337-Amphidinium_carterae.1
MARSVTARTIARSDACTVLDAFDFDCDGSIGTHDLEVAQHLDTVAKENRRRDMWIIVALLVSLLVLAAAMFGVSYAAVELAKEVHIDNNGVMETSSGDVVRVGSADMKVLGGALYEQGRLAGGQCNNRTGECSPLPNGGYSHAVATRAAEEMRFLSSRTADDVFRNLDKISLALHGLDGVGMNMTLKVHGFMRTRSNTNDCGSVVRLDVLHGTVIIDGSDIHFDHLLLQHFEAQGVLSLVSGPVSLRLWPAARQSASLGSGYLQLLRGLRVRVLQRDRASQPQTAVRCHVPGEEAMLVGRCVQVEGVPRAPSSR